MSRPQRLNNNITRLVTCWCSAVAALLLAATSLCGQSLDPNAPSPVRSSDVKGIIAARDLGDARLTDHYYAFTGTPGDLLITVQSQNLNGDIDVFTAGTLRPLMKLTLYAEVSTPVTKSIYLRRRENLVLRIEARSPSDEDGTYSLRFGGAFEPIVGGPDIGETETPAVPKAEIPATGRKTTRVNSAGARIAEPEPPEVAAAPTPEPKPEPTPEAKPAESPKPAAEKPAEENTRPTSRGTRNPRRPSTRRTTPRNTETARAPADKPKAEPKPEPKPESQPAQPAAKPEPPPDTGPRLVIETTDGTLINRPMSGVRRVTVENGQVVVVGRDGKISRFLLADVVRMAIAP